MANKQTKIHYQRPQLAPYQLDAVFTDARYAVVEASTKAGKTSACLVWIIEQASKYCTRQSKEQWLT